MTNKADYSVEFASLIEARKGKRSRNWEAQDKNNLAAATIALVVSGVTLCLVIVPLAIGIMIVKAVLK